MVNQIQLVYLKILRFWGTTDNKVLFYQWTDQILTTWTLTLRPKLSGKLKIPSISFRGEKTDEITVDVRNANNSKIFNPGDQIIFTETEVDNKSVYVNQQIILTIRLLPLLISKITLSLVSKYQMPKHTDCQIPTIKKF